MRRKVNLIQFFLAFRFRFDWKRLSFTHVPDPLKFESSGFRRCAICTNDTGKRCCPRCRLTTQRRRAASAADLGSPCTEACGGNPRGGGRKAKRRRQQSARGRRMRGSASPSASDEIDAGAGERRKKGRRRVSRGGGQAWQVETLRLCGNKITTSLNQLLSTLLRG